MILTTKNTKI